MISIYDPATLAAALAQPLPADLRHYIERHIKLARANGLSDDATHILVIQPGDTETAIEDEIGFSPVIDMEGRRFGDPDFVPYWDHLQDHGGWYEIIDTIGNSEFAFILLIACDLGVLPALLAMCTEVHS